MDLVNDQAAEPEVHVVRLRCRACGRGLGRWFLQAGGGRAAVMPFPRPGTRLGAVAFGPEAAGRGEPAPGFRSLRPLSLVQDRLDLLCACRRGYERRRVSISAAGLLRLLARLGSPDEVEV